jgi:protein gp37
VAENSKIEWTHHTMNFWLGCTALSPACDHCYAEGWAKRTGNAALWQGERRRTSAALWRQPGKWNLACAAAGIRQRVFTNSLADFFDNQADEGWRIDAWVTIHQTPNLDWMILTKRPENIRKMLPGGDTFRLLPWGEGWPNVWLGTTIEDRARLHRLDKLRAVPAAVRFLSIEPLLEDLGQLALSGIHLVIVGGESGGKARPMHPEWVRSLRDQCIAQGVPFFFKQWGEWAPDARRRDWSIVANDDALLVDDPRLHLQQVSKVGKKVAGRLLDGVEHNGMPEVRS